MPSRKCLHCGRVRRIQGRGLCWSCNRDRTIRNQYPLLRPRNMADDYDGSEPTMEELDAIIAEQMKPENLPDWWHEC